MERRNPAFSFLGNWLAFAAMAFARSEKLLFKFYFIACERVSSGVITSERLDILPALLILAVILLTASCFIWSKPSLPVIFSRKLSFYSIYLTMFSVLVFAIVLCRTAGFFFASFISLYMWLSSLTIWDIKRTVVSLLNDVSSGSEPRPFGYCSIFCKCSSSCS